MLMIFLQIYVIDGVGYQTILTCGFDSFFQVLLTSGLDRKKFKTIILKFKSHFFYFVQKIIKESQISPSDYRRRAKVLVPYIQKVFPNQMEIVKRKQIQNKNTDVFEVDCTCNFGDCLNSYFLSGQCPNFEYELAPCDGSHNSCIEGEATIKIQSTLLISEEFVHFLEKLTKFSTDFSCSMLNNDGTACKGRRTKRLIRLGKIIGF